MLTKLLSFIVIIYITTVSTELASGRFSRTFFINDETSRLQYNIARRIDVYNTAYEPELNSLTCEQYNIKNSTISVFNPLYYYYKSKYIDGDVINDYFLSSVKYISKSNSTKITPLEHAIYSDKLTAAQILLEEQCYPSNIEYGEKLINKLYTKILLENMFEKILKKESTTKSNYIKALKLLYPNFGHFLEEREEDAIDIINNNDRREIKEEKNELIVYESASEHQIRDQVKSHKTMPQYVKDKIYEEIDGMDENRAGEKKKQTVYATTLLKFPWVSPNDTNIFTELSKDNEKGRAYLKKVNSVLTDQVFGHNDTKRALEETIAKWIFNPNAGGKSIGLHGPPGVGKTLIAQKLAKALGIPYTEIKLNSVSDGHILKGFSYTYLSAMPGLIVKKMTEVGSQPCVMYFDELDKTALHHNSDEIQDILMGLTDPNTNKEFTDNFFDGINFPLNKVLFVFAYNDKTRVNQILRDRLQEIKVNPYTVSDKISIAKEYLLKEVCESNNINKDVFNFEDNVVEYLIKNYANREAGVRELKRQLNIFVDRICIEQIRDDGPFKNVNVKDPLARINVTIEIIKNYLGAPKIEMIRKIHNHSSVGEVNGLYATTIGTGGIIPFHIKKSYVGNSFELKMTGEQGNVMKESVEKSFTTAINLVIPEARESFLKYNKQGLHIDAVGSNQKDGPSAGSALTIGFLSVILDKRIRNDYSMTGVIELSGKISAIGGLEYKLPGAKLAGVNTVLIPKENEEDYLQIRKTNTKLFEDGFRVILIDDIYEAASYMLLENDNDQLNVSAYFVEQ